MGRRIMTISPSWEILVLWFVCVVLWSLGLVVVFVGGGDFGLGLTGS